MKNKILEEKNLQSLSQVELMKNFLPNREKPEIEIAPKDSEKHMQITNKKMNFEFSTVNFTKLMTKTTCSEIKNMEKFYLQKYEIFCANMMEQIGKINKTFDELQNNEVIHKKKCILKLYKVNR